MNIIWLSKEIYQSLGLIETGTILDKHLAAWNDERI